MPPSAAAEADFERAIGLYRAGDLEAAHAALGRLLAREPGFAMAWNALGYVARDRGDAAGAAAAFDRALGLDPHDPMALRGRARMALERGERNVSDRYRALLAAVPDDPFLQLEATEASVGAGDRAAIDRFRRFVATKPGWTEGQVALARMQWEELRDPAFDNHLTALARGGHVGAEFLDAWIKLLIECSEYGRAAEVAALAAASLGDAARFGLMEAVSAGRAGDVARADALFARLPVNMPGRAVHESVHLIRKGDLEAALAMVERALAESPEDVSAWGIAELLFRKLGDPRAHWLSLQPNLVQTRRLDLDDAFLAELAPLLGQLIDGGLEASGQSVRHGRQTRWRLFDRAEPPLATLRAAIEREIAGYRQLLPPRDASHPLLRHRDAHPRITGSWSVRLTPGGYHTSHIHPLGWLSSACYIAVPDPGVGGELELGRPPADFQLDLEPIHAIVPQVGELTLFPSYLQHGTTPLRAGTRIAVAFDVVAR